MTQNDSLGEQLNSAIVTQDRNAVLSALSRGALPDSLDKYGSRPLIDAVKFRDLDIVRDLLSAGANVFLRDNIGDTAAYHACFGGNEKALELIMAAAGDNGAELVDEDGLAILTDIPAAQGCLSMLRARRGGSGCVSK